MNKAVPIPKSTIIELRQKNDNTLVVNDGEFNVNLNEQNIILEEGDTLQLKSVYLDTGSVETGFIDLAPDEPQPQGADPNEPVTTISIDVGKYLMNVPSSQEGNFYTTNTADKPIVNSKVRCPQFATQVEQVNGFSDRIRANTDGKPYVMCLATESGANTMWEITGFYIQTSDPKTGRNPNPDPSAFLSVPVHFQMTYYLANLPVSPQSLRTANFYFDPKYLTTQKRTELLSRFEGNTLTINQGILDDFREAWGNSDNLGQYSSVPDFVQPVPPPPASPTPSQNAPTIKRIISSVYPNPKYLLYLFNPSTIGVAPNTNHLSPIIETISFRLPSTRYTSSELAKRITQEASKVATGGVIGSKEYVSTDNPLYRSINDEIKRQNATFEPSADDATAVGLMTNGKVVFVEVNSDADERETFRFNSFKTTDRNYMVGSSGGFSLEYDEESDKFSIQNIHSPLRDQNPSSNSMGAPQVRGYAQPFMRGNGTANVPTPLNVKFYVNKYSGIFIAGLSPPDLWRRQMKFDMTSIVPNITSSGVTKKIGKAPVGGADTREEYLIDCDNTTLIDGQHITGVFESVGTAEQHGVSLTNDPATGGGASATSARITAGSSTFDTIINFLPATEAQQSDPTESVQPVPYIATNTDQVINIFSQGQIDDGQHDVADEGYYKVVVDSKISNELVGANNTIRNVSAIISKYNSYGNFTSAYGEGSVSYTHQGQPLTLTDFRVKILTPDGSLATDLNDRNTIFLELIKNV